AEDDGFLSELTTVTITVDDPATNQPPVAGDRFYFAQVDTPLTVDQAQGVLSAASDADDDPLTARLVGEPTHGAVDLAADGSFTYTTEHGFHGIDAFTFRVSDGTDVSDVATATIVVNTPPVGVDDAYATTQETPLVVGLAKGVLANDTD